MSSFLLLREKDDVEQPTFTLFGINDSNLWEKFSISLLRFSGTIIRYSRVIRIPRLKMCKNTNFHKYNLLLYLVRK